VFVGNSAGHPSRGYGGIRRDSTRFGQRNWAAAQNEGESASEPHVAVNFAGDAVTVWKRYNGTRWVIQGAARPRGGAWRPAENVSSEANSSSEPEVAVDPQGDAVAVWEHYNGSNGVIQAAGYDADPNGRR
jgi:hypothetical protein